MKLGLQMTYFTYPGGAERLGETFGRIVRDAESAGFYSAWVMDHFFQIGGWGPPEREMLEAYSALSYAAALTSRIKLGAMVTGVTYRYPGILVKTATTLDVLSGGRSYFGIGAAWNEKEHAGLGRALPAPQRALRAARRDAAGGPPDVERRRRARSRASICILPAPSTRPTRCSARTRPS